MRVVMVSKALVVGAYQRKAEEIAALGVDLIVFTPPEWNDSRGPQPLELRHTTGYDLRPLPVRFNNNFHLHYYPTLGCELSRLRPDVLHMDEEPYNLATWHALRAAKKQAIPSLFFTWQNLLRRYPPPFSWFERQCYRIAPVAIAGNQDAATFLRAKGYRNKISILPQFGVDPNFFQAISGVADPHPTLVIGYAGGLVAEKGVDLLLRACAQLRGDWRVEIVGDGSERVALQQVVAELAIEQRVVFCARRNSSDMPAFYQQLAVLVVPSRSVPGWKEQFGRVIIEAMACQVAVIGSDSGEIPNVIGAAGLIFAEEDVAGLRTHLQHLLDYPDEARRLGQLGRARVLERYTMQQIAAQTVEIYTSMAQNKK